MLSAQERVFAVSTVLAVAAIFAVSRGAADEGTQPSPTTREIAKQPSMRVETQGPESGQPLVVLIAASDSESDVGQMLPTFAKTRRVIFVDVEQQRGDTSVVPRLNDAEIADELSDVLRELAVPSADIIGSGAGGGVATQLALRHPALTRRLILLGSAEHDGIAAIRAPVLLLAGRRDARRPKHLITLTTEFLQAEIRPAS